jgi:hypothetical protein
MRLVAVEAQAHVTASATINPFDISGFWCPSLVHDQTVDHELGLVQRLDRKGK